MAGSKPLPRVFHSMLDVHADPLWRWAINQFGAWPTVHIGKWCSWSLMVIMTFTMVANLKHIKAHIHVPE